MAKPLVETSGVNHKRLDIHEITRATDWDTHADRWREIADASDHATVFQTWEWTRTWWRHFGTHRRLLVLRFTENHETVGFGAFFSPRAQPLRVLRFVGTGGSDYLDLIARPGGENAVASAFHEWTRTEALGRFDALDLQQIRPGGVLGQAQNRENTADRLPGETCPFLPLPATWDDFRRTLSKKFRGNLGYSDRQLDKQFGTVNRRLATARTLDRDLNAFFELHQKRWRGRWMPGAFATRDARRFHTDAAEQLLGANRLRLHIIELDGVVRAALYCFQKGTCCTYYLGGFDPDMARLSLGTVLTARAIRHAIEADQATEFDFLRGDEPYKYRWNAQNRWNRRLLLTRPNAARGRLVKSLGILAMHTESRFKSWMHQRFSQGFSGGVSGKNEGERADG